MTRGPRPLELGKWRTGEEWLRLQEMTQRINPTKQGYRQNSVPATGVIWSTVWFAIAPGKRQGGPYGGIVYGYDLRLGYANCQVDGFK